MSDENEGKSRRIPEWLRKLGSIFALLLVVAQFALDIWRGGWLYDALKSIVTVAYDRPALLWVALICAALPLLYYIARNVFGRRGTNTRLLQDIPVWTLAAMLSGWTVTTAIASMVYIDPFDIEKTRIVLHDIEALGLVPDNEAHAPTRYLILADPEGFTQEKLERLVAPMRVLEVRGLDLSGAQTITDLSPLADVPSLWSLDLTQAKGITDLSPLTALSGFYRLDLEQATGIDDLTPLAAMTSLKSLNLGGAHGVRTLAPLSGLSLERLNFFNFSSPNPMEVFDPPRHLETLAPLRGMDVDIIGAPDWLMKTLDEDASSG